MNKIICDVCGTSYPETANQCPICGCARPGDAKSVAGETGKRTEGGSYNFVRGGHFSKGNVRRRNSTKQTKAGAPAESNSGTSAEKTANIGLVVTAVLLLLAIIAVVVYICLRVFLPDWLPAADADVTDPVSDTSISSTNATGSNAATDAPGETSGGEDTPADTQIP